MEEKMMNTWPYCGQCAFATESGCACPFSPKECLEAMAKNEENSDITRYMEVAVKNIKHHLPKNMCVDDTKWGETCFEVNIFKCEQPDFSLVSTYRFYYDKDDVFERSLYQQMMDWLGEITDELTERYGKEK